MLKVSASKSATVGFLSRIDYLSPGFRTGLLKVAFKVFQEERVHFIVLSGGLISYRDFRRRLSEITAEAIERQKVRKIEERLKPPEERESIESQKEVREGTREILLQDIAEELAKVIPELKTNRGKLVKIFVVLAPPHNYDGPVGVDIAHRLERLRDDIVFWDEASAQFVLKGGLHQEFGVVLPEKSVWRSKYGSTSFDRLVEDREKQTAHRLPDLWVSGCGAVSLIRPAGELARPRISLPGLHVLQEVTTSENQVGVRIVEFSDSDFPLVRTVSLKDLTSREREFIPDPEGASEEQLAILAEIRKRPSTIGMLEDALPWKRRTIERHIKAYNEQEFKPAIVLDGIKYDVSAEWLQRDLRYPLPLRREIESDTILSFGCLHAGYNRTQYQYFVERVPQLILQHGVQTLVGAGDFIAGLKHNLHLRGEVYAGTNYTDHEKMAAELVAHVIMKVFRERFDLAVSRANGTLTEARLVKKVKKALLRFNFIEGNHDKWVMDHGMDPLHTFKTHLTQLLVQRIYEHLSEQGISFNGAVHNIVSNKLIMAKESELPSGITLSLRHPEMGRMQTSSGRAQQTLWDAPGQVVVLANFHVTTMVEEWNEELGQRVGLQVGTLVSGTDFEDGKNKSVDTGVAIVNIRSHKGRIFATEALFDGPSKDELTELDREDLMDQWRSKVGIA